MTSSICLSQVTLSDVCAVLLFNRSCISCKLIPRVSIITKIEKIIPIKQKAAKIPKDVKRLNLSVISGNAKVTTKLRPHDVAAAIAADIPLTLGGNTSPFTANGRGPYPGNTYSNT